MTAEAERQAVPSSLCSTAGHVPACQPPDDDGLRWDRQHCQRPRSCQWSPGVLTTALPTGETEWEVELRGPWEVAGEDWREKGKDRRRTSLQCNVTVLGQDPLLHWVTSQL